MALLQTLRSLVTERLSAAAEEICGSVEQIIAAYEDEACSLKQEIDHQNKLLDMVLKPYIKLHRLDGLVKDEPQSPQIKPEQEEILLRPEQHMNSSLLQEEPQLQQVKEEQEELLLRPDGGVPLLAVKHECDGESREAEAVAIYSPEHPETLADAEDTGTPQPAIDDQDHSSHCFGSDTEVCDELEETKEYQSGLNTRTSHTSQHMDMQNNSLGNNQAWDPTSSKQLTKNERPFTCTICGKGYRRQHDLKIHIMTHTGERPFKCKVCGKGFIRKSHLKAHTITHTGEILFTCTVCGKSCRRKFALKVHMMTHTGETPFNCKVCGKGFTQKTHLKAHTITHTGEIPFTCTVCGKSCRRKFDLKVHMRTHTGEMPFTCDVCGKGCISAGNLKRHKMVHTGEKPFTCTVCGKGFTNPNNLIRHMKTH